MAAQRILEMDVNFLARPAPPAAQLNDKCDFAAGYIKEEFEAFGSRKETDPAEDQFIMCTRTHVARIYYAGGILQGMLLRVRMQAAVFNCFMQLCAKGVCSLRSLEYPMTWSGLPGTPGSLLRWIIDMVDCFGEPTHSHWNSI